MIAGVAFAVLYATAVLVMPALPGADGGATRVQALLLAFSTLALAAVLAVARDRLTGPSAHLFTIGSAVLVAQLGVAIWFTVGPALRPGQLDTGAARVVGDVGSMWLPAATIANIWWPSRSCCTPTKVTCHDGSASALRCSPSSS